jgi:hypothetical protein
MNFKSVIAVGLGLATVALSLPARADEANIIRVEQQSITTGTRNVTNQNSKVGISTFGAGNRTSKGTATDVFQGSETTGKWNSTNQNSDIRVNSTSIRNR